MLEPTTMQLRMPMRIINPTAIQKNIKYAEMKWPLKCSGAKEASSAYSPEQKEPASLMKRYLFIMYTLTIERRPEIAIILPITAIYSSANLAAPTVRRNPMKPKMYTEIARLN